MQLSKEKFSSAWKDIVHDELMTQEVFIENEIKANNQMFGLERMLKSLNSHRGGSMDELISGVKADIDDFVDGAPQFDDTTMLAFRFKSVL